MTSPPKYQIDNLDPVPSAWHPLGCLYRFAHSLILPLFLCGQLADCNQLRATYCACLLYTSHSGHHVLQKLLEVIGVGLCGPVLSVLVTASGEAPLGHQSDCAGKWLFWPVLGQVIPELSPRRLKLCWLVKHRLTIGHADLLFLVDVYKRQMVGRGTRLSPGKDHLLLLDFLWHTERHELCHPASLICENAEVAKKMTENIAEAGRPVDIEEAEQKASEDVVAQREEALAKKLQEMKSRKRKLVDPLQFEMSIQAEDLSSYAPSFGWEMGPPSDKQVRCV